MPTFAAADAEQAVAHATALFAQGSTVVLKILSRDIVHKSDVGGVVLNLTSPDAVRKATADILARARSLRPDARISGVMVQAMVVRAKARELILGLADDPTFGTVVVFGRGGTAVEIINDKALALPPLDLQLARSLIERTRVSRLLRAYRDVPAVKHDAVAMVLVKLAQMAADIPEIRGLDINPLLADEAGVLAVDARVAIGRVERKFLGSGPANFAVRPYPSQWQRHIEVKDGWRVFVRPIRPEDEPLIHEMLKHVSMHDLRLRFFAPMKQFSHEFIARLTQLDYARAMAFVAFDEASNELVGVVGGALDPIEVKRLFDAYEIAVVPTFAAADAEEAVAHANAIFAQGSTVVLKIMSRDIVHKSDVGGVVLNLTSADAVRKATAEILARARSLRPEARISGVMVQAMVVRAKARELILGLADDPTFGTVVVFGRGGTAVEIINDKALALPPLDLQLARSLIERTRVSRLLRAYRDVPAVKQDAVAMVLVKLAQMAADIPEIRGLDINPLLADEAGVLAVDARVVIGRVERKFRGSGPANFAVRPYPSQWQRHIEVKDGWRVYVRPIRPEDEPLIHGMLKHVTMQDLRLRFFAPMKEFSHEFIARLTQLDYARAMAFVAFDEATNELVGVVRIHSDSIYESGEYAILLRSDLKGRGLGWALMQMIIEYAKSEGLKAISGDVLADNTVMLAMCRSLGFEVKSDPDEHDICNVRLAL